MAKRKSGQRTAKGRLKNRATPFDYGNVRVELRSARFARFQDGKAGQQVHDAIGRVWAVGLLENERVDPAALRDAGREYACRYWGYYGTSVGVANYEGDCRRGSGLADGQADRPGELFEAMDERLANAGKAARDAVHALCVDYHFFPDDEPEWASALVNDRFAAKSLSVVGALSVAKDRERLAHAVAGLLALCEGVQMRRAA
jgi:hypothetical protein